MNTMLAAIELARLPQAEWEIQIEVWENAGRISPKQAGTLLEMISQWIQTGCPLTFGRVGS